MRDLLALLGLFGVVAGKVGIYRLYAHMNDIAFRAYYKNQNRGIWVVTASVVVSMAYYLVAVVICMPKDQENFHGCVAALGAGVSVALISVISWHAFVHRKLINRIAELAKGILNGKGWVESAFVSKRDYSLLIVPRYGCYEHASRELHDICASIAEEVVKSTVQIAAGHTSTELFKADRYRKQIL